MSCPYFLSRTKLKTKRKKLTLIHCTADQALIYDGIWEHGTPQKQYGYLHHDGKLQTKDAHELKHGVVCELSQYEDQVSK